MKPLQSGDIFFHWVPEERMPLRLKNGEINKLLENDINSFHPSIPCYRKKQLLSVVIYPQISISASRVLTPGYPQLDSRELSQNNYADEYKTFVIFAENAKCASHTMAILNIVI